MNLTPGRNVVKWFLSLSLILRIKLTIVFVPRKPCPFALIPGTVFTALTALNYFVTYNKCCWNKGYWKKCLQQTLLQQMLLEQMLLEPMLLEKMLFEQMVLQQMVLQKMVLRQMLLETNVQITFVKTGVNISLLITFFKKLF
jgi:hypothetical protein